MNCWLIVAADGKAGNAKSTLCTESPEGTNEKRRTIIVRLRVSQVISTEISRLVGLTAVYILEANDVVFTQISPRLHFDDVQRNFAGVIDAML